MQKEGWKAVIFGIFESCNFRIKGDPFFFWNRNLHVKTCKYTPSKYKLSNFVACRKLYPKLICKSYSCSVLFRKRIIWEFTLPETSLVRLTFFTTSLYRKPYIFCHKLPSTFVGTILIMPQLLPLLIRTAVSFFARISSTTFHTPFKTKNI